MHISADDIPFIMEDNDWKYFNLLEGVINSIDHESRVKIIKNPNTYLTRIYPSVPAQINNLISGITKFHTLIGIHIDLSKSIKKTNVISYEINLLV